MEVGIGRSVGESVGVGVGEGNGLGYAWASVLAWDWVCA